VPGTACRAGTILARGEIDAEEYQARREVLDQ
jgi:hypothetical protein